MSRTPAAANSSASRRVEAVALPSLPAIMISAAGRLLQVLRWGRRAAPRPAMRCRRRRQLRSIRGRSSNRHGVGKSLMVGGMCELLSSSAKGPTAGIVDFGMAGGGFPGVGLGLRRTSGDRADRRRAPAAGGGGAGGPHPGRGAAGGGAAHLSGGGGMAGDGAGG